MRVSWPFDPGLVNFTSRPDHDAERSSDWTMWGRSCSVYSLVAKSSAEGDTEKRFVSDISLHDAKQYPVETMFSQHRTVRLAR